MQMDIKYREEKSVMVRIGNGRLRKAKQIIYYNSSPVTDVDRYLIYCLWYRDRLSIDEVSCITGRNPRQVAEIVYDVKDAKYSVGTPINWYRDSIPVNYKTTTHVFYEPNDKLTHDKVARLIGATKKEAYDLIESGAICGGIKKSYMHKKIVDGMEINEEAYRYYVPYRYIKRYCIEHDIEEGDSTL